jgi:hypothetical protein
VESRFDPTQLRAKLATRELRKLLAEEQKKQREAGDPIEG